MEYPRNPMAGYILDISLKDGTKERFYVLSTLSEVAILPPWKKGKIEVRLHDGDLEEILEILNAVEGESRKCSVRGAHNK